VGDWLAATIDAESWADLSLSPPINVPDKLPAVRVLVPAATASPPRTADIPCESSGLDVSTIVVTPVDVDELPVELALVTPVPVLDTVEKE
jgi:hypothetical protein